MRVQLVHATKQALDPSPDYATKITLSQYVFPKVPN
jgi:hypothetical protein